MSGNGTTTGSLVWTKLTARWSWWVSLVMVLSGYALSTVATAIRPDDTFALLYLAIGALGMVISIRVPENPVGWLLLGTGVLAAIQTLATGVADVVLIAGSGSRLLGLVAAMFSVAVWPVITFVPLIPVLLLFPDGALLSRRWRVVLWLSAVGIAGTSLGLLLLDAPDGESLRWPLPTQNPIATEFGEMWLAVTFTLVLAALISAALSLVIRLRRSEREEKLRIKWVVYGGSLAVPMWILGGALLDETFLGGILASVALALVPASIGAAILRFRLYDIDRLISRTVTYTLIAGLLAAVYASITLGLPQVLPISLDSPLLIAGATLSGAALFNPLRKSLQAKVDRRFNRGTYDAQSEVDDFTELMRKSIEMEDVTSGLVEAVARTMQPASMSVWVRVSDEE